MSSSEVFYYDIAKDDVVMAAQDLMVGKVRRKKRLNLSEKRLAEALREYARANVELGQAIKDGRIR